MKIEFLKKKKDFLKKDESQIKPDFSWKIILYLTLAIILVSFIFGFNLFVQINKEQPDSSTSPSLQANIVKKARIEKVLNIFSERDKKSADALSSPSSLVDPSL